MAYYKGREVSVESHIPVEYQVIVVHGDGVHETVNLAELILSKREIVEFVKGESKRMQNEKEKQDRKKEKEEHKEEVKKLDKVPVESIVGGPVSVLPGEPVEVVPIVPVEPTLSSKNPFSPKVKGNK